MPHAAVTHLHFIGDAHAPLGTHQAIHLLQVTRWQGDATGVAVHRFTDKPGQLTLARGDFRQVMLNTSYIVRRAVRPAEFTAVSIGRGHRVYPIRAAAQGLGVIGNRGGHGIRRHRPAVVGLQHAEHVAPAAVGPGQTNRQVIGLRAAVDQEHPVHALWRQRQQALGELGNCRIVKARVGVEQRPLPSRHLSHARVAMAQHGHVVEHVEVGSALHIDQVVTPAALDTRWVGVVVLLGAGKAGIPPGQQGLRVQFGLSITGQAQQRRG